MQCNAINRTTIVKDRKTDYLYANNDIYSMHQEDFSCLVNATQVEPYVESVASGSITPELAESFRKARAEGRTSSYKAPGSSVKSKAHKKSHKGREYKLIECKPQRQDHGPTLDPAAIEMADLNMLRNLICCTLLTAAYVSASKSKSHLFKLHSHCHFSSSRNQLRWKERIDLIWHLHRFWSGKRTVQRFCRSKSSSCRSRYLFSSHALFLRKGVDLRWA